MEYLTNDVLLICVFVLILCFGIAIAVAAIREKRKEKAMLFRAYFGSQYERDLLEHSAQSESRNWDSESHSQEPVRVRDSWDDEE